MVCRTKVNAWSVLLVAVLVASLLVAPGALAEGEDASTWSWSTTSADGGLAVRLGFDFVAGDSCTLTFSLTARAQDGVAELFAGRDDESLAFAVLDLKEEGGWSGFADLPGAVRFDGDVVGDVRRAEVSVTGKRAPHEEWVFSGFTLATATGRSDPAFSVSVSCGEAFAVGSLEAAREVAMFSTTDTRETMDGLPVYVSGAALTVGAAEDWTSTAPRTVMRYHQFTLGVDAAHVRIYGPDVSAEATPVMTSWNGIVSLRIEGGPGGYGYTMTHVALTYLAGGVVYGFHPVDDLDQWSALPTF